MFCKLTATYTFILTCICTLASSSSGATTNPSIRPYDTHVPNQILDSPVLSAVPYTFTLGSTCYRPAFSADPVLMGFLKGNLTRLLRSQTNLYSMTETSYQTYVNQPRVNPGYIIDPKTIDPQKIGGWYFPRDTCTKLSIQMQANHMEGEIEALARALNEFHHDLTAYKMIIANVSMMEYRRLCSFSSGCPTATYQCNAIDDDNRFYCTSLGDLVRSLNDTMFFLRRTLTNFNFNTANTNPTFQVKFVNPEGMSDYITSVYTQLALYYLKENLKGFIKDCMATFLHVFSISGSGISLF